MKARVTCAMLLLAGAALLGLTGSPLRALTSDPSWDPRVNLSNVADSGQLNGSDRHLVYDHHGEASVILGYEYSDPVYFYHCIEGSGWSYVAGYGIEAVSPSLAIDRHERPWLGFVDGDVLWCNHYSGTAWQSANVATGIGSAACMALDAYGRPAFVYLREEHNPGVMYVCDTDGDNDWTDETPTLLSQGYDAYYNPKLVFDSLNRPCVAYSAVDASFNAQLHLLTRQWGTWGGRAVVSGDTLEGGYSVSLAVDPITGTPAVATTSGPGVVTYVHWAGDAFVAELPGAGFTPSLAFDPADGLPVIAYLAPGEDLGLMYYDGEGWNYVVVDGVGHVGYCPSLAFNPYGDDPFGIAYYDSEGDSLYFIEDPRAVPEPATLTLLLAGCGALALRRRRARRTS